MIDFIIKFIKYKKHISILQRKNCLIIIDRLIMYFKGQYEVIANSFPQINRILAFFYL